MATSEWTTEAVGGHPCEVFTPATINEAGHVLIYLHGVHLASLSDKAAYLEQFERFGLPVVAPQSQRSWWLDRVCC